MKQSRWAVGLVGLCMAISGSSTSRQSMSRAQEVNVTRPDLTGVVEDGEGKPLPQANVFIYTAGPKVGTGILCPSCYADCRKRTTTDAEGRFKIESLDPNLLFRILVVAKGKQPEFVAKIDPAVKPVEVTLQPAREGFKPEQQVQGRVVDPEGKPISGAVVSIRGVTRGESTQFGGNNDMDEVAVSDDQGLFTITGQRQFDAVGVEVEARAYAKGIFEHLATGAKVHELKLAEGVSVSGRLVNRAEPVAGAEIGICGADRRAEIYVGDYSVGTDKDGRFLFVNLPPDREYFIYGKMASLGEKGAVLARRVHVNNDGSKLDIGDLAMAASFKLAGQLRLSDGEPVPPNTRVLLSRDEAWDSIQTQADAEGRFSFLGVPSESISLSGRIMGYHLSERNRSLDLMNHFSLVGLIKTNKTDLIVQFEPGQNVPRGMGGRYIDLRQEPLLGAEAAKGRSGDVHVTGTVIDAETKKPIDSFTVTEGLMPGFPETPQWFTGRQNPGTNGQLEVFLNKGQAQPAIMVEADGYLPQSSGPITATETNMVFALKRGTATAGVILKPDGTPLADAVVYLADMQNGVNVQNNDMRVDNRGFQTTRSTSTDEHGKFSFRPGVDDYAVLVLEDEGFAKVMVEDLRRNPEVRLEPWARVQGKLMIGSRPGAHEEVHVWAAHMPYGDYPRNFPALEFYLKTETDSDGRFSFERVPPVAVQVYHGPKVKDEKMGMNPMSQITGLSLKPGEVATVTIGGQGRPVIGKVVVNGYEGEIKWRSDVFSIDKILPPIEDLPDQMALFKELVGKMQAADAPEEKNRLSDQMRKMQQETALKTREFYAAQKGREYFFQNKRYCLNFTKDGHFRIEDVPGGKYRLNIDLREGTDYTRFSHPPIASIKKELEIPESPGGRTDEPFDVGTIEMQALKAISAGQLAPDFQVKTVDDKPLKLSDYAGKYVLLDFWAVWCGPCVAETPHLKRTYQAFKDDPRFQMIGLSLDPNIKTPSDYARKNDLGWIMGFLGDWSKTDLPSTYGVQGIPSIFLIGPDGKIIAKDLRGEDIKAAVEGALAKSTPPGELQIIK